MVSGTEKSKKAKPVHVSEAVFKQLIFDRLMDHANDAGTDALTEAVMSVIDGYTVAPVWKNIKNAKPQPGTICFLKPAVGVHFAKCNVSDRCIGTAVKGGFMYMGSFIPHSDISRYAELSMPEE